MAPIIGNIIAILLVCGLVYICGKNVIDMFKSEISGGGCAGCSGNCGSCSSCSSQKTVKKNLKKNFKKKM